MFNLLDVWFEQDECNHMKNEKNALDKIIVLIWMMTTLIHY